MRRNKRSDAQRTVYLPYYRGGSFIGYCFKWNKRMYRVEDEPYQLLITGEDKNDCHTVRVDSFFDCGTFFKGILFWGDRLGRISGYDMAKRKRCFFSYMNEEARAFYEEHAAMYPDTFPPRSGSYDYLPEINMSNFLSVRLSITALTAHKKYVLAGDLSGRVSIFDAATSALIASFSVEGAVVGITVKCSRLLIDSIKTNKPCYIEDLRRYEQGVRTCIKWKDALRGKVGEEKRVLLPLRFQ